jgi:hypothetical protein
LNENLLLDGRRKLVLPLRNRVMKFGYSPTDTLLENPASRKEGSARNTVKNQDYYPDVGVNILVPTYS